MFDKKSTKKLIKKNVKEVSGTMRKAYKDISKDFSKRLAGVRSQLKPLTR